MHRADRKRITQINDLKIALRGIGSTVTVTAR
jgi:hypothetical protein